MILLNCAIYFYFLNYTRGYHVLGDSATKGAFSCFMGSANSVFHLFLTQWVPHMVSIYSEMMLPENCLYLFWSDFPYMIYFFYDMIFPGTVTLPSLFGNYFYTWPPPIMRRLSIVKNIPLYNLHLGSCRI